MDRDQEINGGIGADNNFEAQPNIEELNRFAEAEFLAEDRLKERVHLLPWEDVDPNQRITPLIFPPPAYRNNDPINMFLVHREGEQVFLTQQDRKKFWSTDSFKRAFRSPSVVDVSLIILMILLSIFQTVSFALLKIEVYDAKHDNKLKCMCCFVPPILCVLNIGYNLRYIPQDTTQNPRGYLRILKRLPMRPKSINEIKNSITQTEASIQYDTITASFIDFSYYECHIYKMVVENSVQELEERLVIQGVRPAHRKKLRDDHKNVILAQKLKELVLLLFSEGIKYERLCRVSEMYEQNLRNNRRKVLRLKIIATGVTLSAISILISIMLYKH